MRQASLAALAAFAALSGCASGGPRLLPHATVALRDAAGEVKGSAALTELRDGLYLSASVQGLAPGSYGMHLHQTGICAAPSFASAGPHWNPAGREHGSANPMGPHAGDLPNLVVDSAGRGVFTQRLNADLVKLIDRDGAALVVHAGPDDYRTDPSGNSGARTLCGVLVGA